ncbi:GAF domain-containing protein [Lacticigenium naphthae]|uniref:GAF domain-containing protein n=1 Tax=Lacticigenium naphthae TaxID=515351 RepID=UPI0003FEB46C|nr:GAF domain-containing protein [Lacticigenium naphthae]
MTKDTLLNQQLEAIIEGEENFIANLSNASALLFENLNDINWAGFYLYDGITDELVLGPFQGKVACIRIRNGKGVCGTAFNTSRSFIVDDVHAFDGHIACDAQSNAEIVVPLVKDGKKIGVLDIDSPTFSRFNENDQKELERFADILLKHSKI